MYGNQIKPISILNIEEMIVKTNKSFSLIVTLLMTALVGFVVFAERKTILNWDSSKVDSIQLFCFLFLFTFCILTWMSHFDRKPQLRLNNEGIWRRKIILPFSKLELIQWKDIDYCFTSRETKNGMMTEKLVSKLKGSERKINVGLTGFDISSSKIIKVVKAYSEIYNFKYLDLDV